MDYDLRILDGMAVLAHEAGYTNAEQIVALVPVFDAFLKSAEEGAFDALVAECLSQLRSGHGDGDLSLPGDEILAYCTVYEDGPVVVVLIVDFVLRS